MDIDSQCVHKNSTQQCTAPACSAKKSYTAVRCKWSWSFRSFLRVAGGKIIFYRSILLGMINFHVEFIYLESEYTIRDFPSPYTNCIQSQSPAVSEFQMGGSPGCGEDVGCIQIICPSSSVCVVWLGQGEGCYHWCVSHPDPPLLSLHFLCVCIWAHVGIYVVWKWRLHASYARVHACCAFTCLHVAAYGVSIPVYCMYVWGW